MHIAAVVLGCLLLGQQAPDAALPSRMARENASPAVIEPTIKAATANEAIPAPAPSGANPTRLRPPEMVAAAVLLPKGSTLTGQPLTLWSALAATADRRQQLDATRAYWYLVQTVAEYHFCLDHVQELDRIAPKGNDSPALRLARTSAVAMLRQMELEAVGAQHELARLARLPAGAPLPLPADRPHVGPYRTNFQQLFAGRAPPEPAALMERILPIRRQAVDEQAAAVQAAEDVLAAAMDELHGGRGDAAAVAAIGQELLRQQRAFIRSVCGYNRNIAEYGLAVATPMASPDALVAILIGPVPQGIAPMITADERGYVRPTGANEPTLAPRPEGLQPLGKNEPTLAPPREQPDQQPATEANWVMPAESPPPASSPQPRTANKPAADRTSAAGATSPLYPALLEAAPSVRAKQLTVALHWDRSLPEGIGKPMSLADCLSRDPGADRRAMIAAYWRLRQRAAEYQVLAQEVEMLEALAPAALERRNEPSGAADMLRLRSAQLATQAAVREAHVALVEAQYALALRIGATGDPVWPLASTVPHAGKYLLNIEAQPQTVVASWPVRRLAATVPGLGESVQQYATAVVEADAARAVVAEQYRVGRASIGQAIEGVTAQTRQTMAILETLTDYNRAIADYVLTVMPPTTPANRLATALVLKP